MRVLFPWESFIGCIYSHATEGTALGYQARILRHVFSAPGRVLRPWVSPARPTCPPGALSSHEAVHIEAPAHTPSAAFPEHALRGSLRRPRGWFVPFMAEERDAVWMPARRGGGWVPVWD